MINLVIPIPPPYLGKKPFFKNTSISSSTLFLPNNEYNVLGIDLIFQNREVEVGTYKADIVCKDGYSDDNILIENQLEKTDHKHLGQISTYAAGIKAKTVIWIAEKFTDEHRAAIDWQNSITVDGYNYFGIEVEILKIGNSPLAPNFKIVCKPNNWSKKYSNVSNKSDTKLFYFDYWTKLKEKCDNENSVLKVQSPRYSHWCTIAVGKSGYSLCGTFSSQQKKLSASLYINNDKDGFLELERQKTDIENEIGCKLSWELLPDKQASRIALYKNDIDVNDDNLEKALSWQKTSLEKLHSAFSKRLKKLHSNLDSEAA